MNAIVLEILIVIVLLLLNGFFAMAELAIVSVNKARLSALASKGNKNASSVLKLAENPEPFLATVQIGITLIGIIAGVFSGATLAENLSIFLQNFNLSIHQADSISITVVILGITFFSLVIGELIPKQIALANAERVAMFVVRPISFFSRVSHPFVWLLNISCNLINLIIFPFGKKEKKELAMEDIHHILNKGVKSGEIKLTEKEIAFRVFRLEDKPIIAFMTPRKDIKWIDINDSIEQICHTAFSSSHNSYPVCDKKLDDVIGIISIKDLWIYSASQQVEVDIRKLLRPVLKIVSTRNALSVLEELKKERKTNALIIDEYGCIDGLVTTHDLMEAIVGDLADYEGEEESIFKREDGSLIVDSYIDIQEILLALNIEHSPEMEIRTYNSIGGLIFNNLESMPKTGDRVIWNNLLLEVVDMDGHRIDKVLVSKIKS